MIKKNKFYFLAFLISFLISASVEKYLYTLVPFDFVRATVICISLFIFANISFVFLPLKLKNKVLNILDNSFNYFYSTLKKIYNFKYLIIIKYTFSILLTLYASLFMTNFYYFIFGIIDLLFLFLISNLIVIKYPKVAFTINSILLLLYNVNVFVLIFGGSFISLMMLTNLESIEALRGKALIYISASIITILISTLPIKHVRVSKKENIFCFIVLTIYSIFLLYIYGSSYSPLCNYGLLINDEILYIKKQHYIKNVTYNKKSFYHKNVKNYIKHDFVDKPNIIVVFTEGLSNNIIYDKRNIMPNLKKISKNSISFKNYYNHSAATYRGIIGQLYSGYQMNNDDKNNFISIQKILSDKDYITKFINNEPGNIDFVNYLESLKFDEVINSNNITNGLVSDKNAFDYLYDKALELNNEDNPFFISMYTFSTHVSFDSEDEKYGDGKDNLLNRFYNLDFQFNKFIEKFKNSPLYENTIIIFTTDHASYVDSDYIRVFGNVYERKHEFFDKIPLLIYHKNIKPKEINADGRNSLDLAPTILDYIDISGPNYFLGKSLFSENGTKYDRVYYDSFTFIFDNALKNNNVNAPNEVIENDIYGYLSLSTK